MTTFVLRFPVRGDALLALLLFQSSADNRDEHGRHKQKNSRTRIGIEIENEFASHNEQRRNAQHQRHAINKKPFSLAPARHVANRQCKRSQPRDESEQPENNPRL